MTNQDINEFAAQWAAAWNDRDMERVLARFDEGVEFTSPVAVAVVGAPTVRGKKALRDYWTKALGRIATLHFTIDRLIWDPARRELAIIYTSRIDGQVKRVSEHLTFGETGQVIAGEVFHGITS
jgi:hypothetical protein